LDEDFAKKRAADLNIPKHYRVFEDMLESDIDAVVIATPMQCHVPQALAALEAGKHVLSEVTAGVTMDELFWLCEKVEETQKVYMMAENYIYMQEIQVVKGMVEAGVFGEVYFGEGEYIHDIKNMVTYSYGRFTSGKTSWRKYWQFGRRGSFYPTHSLGPVMKWLHGDRIKTVRTVGTGQWTAPHLRNDDLALTLCTTEKGKLIKIRVDCVSNRPHCATYYSCQGTKGCYEAARGLGDQAKVWFEGIDDKQEKTWYPLKDFYDQYLPERYKKASEDQKKSGHGGGDFFIVEDFVNAILYGNPPGVDVYEACEWTAVAFLSELSVMNGGREMEMPKFRKNMPWEEKIIKI
jgi:predicted dehydrogenase